MYHQYQVVGEFKDIKSYVESCNNTELVAEIDDYVNAYYGGDYNRLIPQSGYIAAVSYTHLTLPTILRV